MAKYIIGAAIAVGAIGIGWIIGAVQDYAIARAGKFEIYYLEGGGRAVAYFRPMDEIPHTWREAQKRCLSYTFIPD